MDQLRVGTESIGKIAPSTAFGSTRPRHSRYRPRSRNPTPKRRPIVIRKLLVHFRIPMDADISSRSDNGQRRKSSGVRRIVFVVYGVGVVRSIRSTDR